MWAESLNDNLYQIDNVPFYAYGISDKDVVLAKDVNGELLFQDVKQNSGHSTYRIFVNDGIEDQSFTQYWKRLEEIGCGKEVGGDGFFAVDVPTETDIYKAYRLLEKGEVDGIWQFEEGKCGPELSD